MSTLGENYLKNSKTENIYTIPNIITFVRFMLIPIAFSIVLQGDNDILAFTLFALAGSTDFIDGMIARRTNTVTELGKVLDPLVDRFLIVAGSLSLFLVGRVPLWMLLSLIIRDAILVSGNTYLRRKGYPPIDVLYIGKITTGILFAGFSGLILNWPKTEGLSLIDTLAFPGFNGEPTSFWIYLLYVGVVLSWITAFTYMGIALRYLRNKDALEQV